jgi:MurNAc alpha-1-phosphate uridylyltransferase
MVAPVRQGMVLAAGLGTRMRPITDTIPKPLVKIAGKPLIDYALDTLKAAGCEKVVVNVHWLADQMEAHLAGYRDMEIIISDERAELLNSGGGLAKGLKLLDPGPAYVMNADLFWIGETWDELTNLERLAGFFDPARMDMALLCVRPENTTGHEGGADFAMGGKGELVRYRPVDGGLPEGEGVVYAGAIVMDSRLLDDAPESAFNLNIYFDRAIAAGRLFGLILDGHWVTAGTPEAIEDAEEAVREFGLSR